MKPIFRKIYEGAKELFKLPNKEEEPQKFKYKIILWLSLLVIIIALIAMIVITIVLDKREATYKALEEQTLVEEKVADDIKAADDTPACPYDFDDLKAINPDIYAWIEIPGTEVNYPVLQSEEDNYYLNTNLDLSGGRPGCIYTNKIDGKDFTTFYSVLYGHNMHDNTMFGSLHYFDDEEFFEEHDKFYIYLEDKTLTYEIYATQNHSDSYLPLEYDVTDVEDRQELIDMSLTDTGDSLCHIRDGASVSLDDNIVILSTCIKGVEDRRFLVFGRLIN